VPRRSRLAGSGVVVNGPVVVVGEPVVVVDSVVPHGELPEKPPDGSKLLAPLPAPTMPVHPDTPTTATFAARSTLEVPPSVVSMSASVTP
jgi:hypothetical protein